MHFLPHKIFAEVMFQYFTFSSVNSIFNGFILICGLLLYIFTCYLKHEREKEKHAGYMYNSAGKLLKMIFMYSFQCMTLKTFLSSLQKNMWEFMKCSNIHGNALYKVIHGLYISNKLDSQHLIWPHLISFNQNSLRQAFL